jgi:HSP20 family protein
MTSSIKWEPIEDLKAIRDLVDQALIRPLKSISLPGLGSFHTLVNLYETGEAYVVEATVPGLEADDLDISVSGHKLTIQGERKSAEATSKCLYRERPRGRLARTLRIPRDVDPKQISAKLSSGVLCVTMPKRKAEEAEAEAAPEEQE